MSVGGTEGFVDVVVRGNKKNASLVRVGGGKESVGAQRAGSKDAGGGRGGRGYDRMAWAYDSVGFRNRLSPERGVRAGAKETPWLVISPNVDNVDGLWPLPLVVVVGEAP